MAAGKRTRGNDQPDDDGVTAADTQGREPSPAAAAADVLLDEMGLREQAYTLHLRNVSFRSIGRRLGIDKDTAQRYVKQIEREMAPRRQAVRNELLRAAIARLRGIVVEASDQLDQTDERDARGAAALLNTRLACEREIARLQGLYESVLSEGDGGGITITISRRAMTTGEALSASGDGLEGSE